MPVVEEGSPLPEERKAAVPDVMKLREHLELAGTGLSQEEAVRLSLALRDLVADNPDMKVKVKIEHNNVSLTTHIKLKQFC